MWLKLGSLQGVSGARLCATLRDYLSVFQASVHLRTRKGNRIVFPFSFIRPVSLSIRQSRFSDRGATFWVSPELARHSNAACYRHTRPAGRTDPAFMALDDPLAMYKLYDLQNANASCINPFKFDIWCVRLGKLQRLCTAEWEFLEMAIICV